MDPNTTIAEIKELQGDLRHAEANGHSAKARRRIESDIKERIDALRVWRRKGGFSPRGGWPTGV